MRESIAVDPYVVDVLMPDLVGHDRHPSSFVVYLYLWRHTNGAREATEPCSLAVVAEETGLSKRAVQMALERLRRRRLVRAQRTAATEPRSFEVLAPWRGASG